MGVRRIYKVGTPYNAVDVNEVDFEQTTDTMYMAHWDYDPTKLLRYDHDHWEFETVTFGPSIAAPTGCSVAATTNNTDTANEGENYFPQPASYCVTAIDDEAGQESRASNTDSASNDLTLKRNYNTVTWTAVTGATRYNVYKAENDQFFGYIGTTDGTTFRDDNIGPALDRSPPEGYNPFEGVNDKPSTVTLFEQRSIWGRTRDAPNAAYASRSGQLENMDRSRPRRADDSLSFSIVAGRVNAINQLVSTTSLLALASDNIFVVDGDGSGAPLAADTPPAARRQIGRGASRLPPLVIDNVVFYAPSSGNSVRTINYKFELDGLASNDVSIFSPHFFQGLDIVSWCYAQESKSLIWAVRSDGALLCFTWEQEQNVWGWTICETEGRFISCCAISEDGEDRVYFLVEREIDGVPTKLVERMAPHEWDDLFDTSWLDSTVQGSFDEPTNRFTGLWHLEGRSDVTAVADGAVFEGLAVTAGVLELPDGITASEIQIGIPYQVDVKTNPIRVTLQDSGSNVGRRQQPGDTVLTLYRSSEIMAGIDESHLFPVKQRALESYGEPTTPFTGDTAPITMDNKAQNSTSVHIRQTKPRPFTMLGVSVAPIING